MKKPDFLAKLRKKRKIELVEPSREISQSYLIKSENCLRASKVLLKEKLLENSVTEAYYAMYNSVLALLFRCGIKSENHTASILLLGRLFNLEEKKDSLSKAKKERIDKQYYLTDDKNYEINEEIALKMIRDAELFILEIRAYIGKLNPGSIQNVRKSFDKM